MNKRIPLQVKTPHREEGRKKKIHRNRQLKSSFRTNEKSISSEKGKNGGGGREGGTVQLREGEDCQGLKKIIGEMTLVYRKLALEGFTLKKKHRPQPVDGGAMKKCRVAQKKNLRILPGTGFLFSRGRVELGVRTS